MKLAKSEMKVNNLYWKKLENMDNKEMSFMSWNKYG